MSASTSSNATVQAADTSYADYKASNFEMDPTISEEERRFYLKAYPSIDLVRERKVHCTVCKQHIGTAPIAESNIKMHPVLRVTHCVKCHDFYNSGEFSKGEDGSELYCRWCGQGGEVYCCSNCPYVFCKSCIVKNLSRGVVADIEQNENWSCFNCAPKILWPLRAQHWALINYIDVQKKYVESLKLPENEARAHLFKDLSHCCRLAKAKCGNMSDSLESLESANSRRSLASGTPAKKSVKVSISPGGQTSAAKRPKTSNDEVVCTPDLLSMLEPDCQLTVKPRTPMSSPITSAPKIMTVQTNYNHPAPLTAPRSSVPPPLVLRNTSIKIRPIAASSPILRRTVIGQRGPSPVGNTTPVYHTINGYRIDLNSAAQQETFRLPNGKLIQVKRQGTAGNTNASPSPSQQQMQQAPSQITGTNHWPQRLNVSVQQGMRNLTCISGPQAGYNAGNYSVQQQQQHQQQQQQQQQQQTQQIPIQHPPAIRYHNTTVRPVGNAINTPNVATAPQPMQMINGTPAQAPNIRPAMVRHVFATTAIGQARTQLQDQIFNAMEICQHLTGKVQTLTNSNAYKQARNYLEVKELYIHLSYLITYAIGRFKGLQDKCLGDMRQLGFVNDADSLENGQLAAAVDYVCYGQLDEVDLFNTGANSFHNQVYEYRKSLQTNLKDGVAEPLPPLFPLGVRSENDPKDEENADEEECWPKDEDNLKDEQEESLYNDNDIEGDDYGSYSGMFESTLETSGVRGTEESMNRDERAHAYDRKLTRLIKAYPSIWCTRHPDYGNFEVTRKQWRVIASHFKNKNEIKLRWKNIRKRFVRIERRMAEGKRFHGYFDKATNYLSNRNLPENEWKDVDCGDDDGDVYANEEHGTGGQRSHDIKPTIKSTERARKPYSSEVDSPNDYDGNGAMPAIRPIEVRAIDAKIINFVKSNPVLWRKSADPQNDQQDEQTRKSLWMHLWKSVPSYLCDDIIARWLQMYEMYKSFRLKTIKDTNTLANLELKYSKYLAKLYFLYKIDEQDLRKESETLQDCESLDGLDVDEVEDKKNIKLQDMPDDKEFVLKLAQTVRQYPALWNKRHLKYRDVSVRSNSWSEVEKKLEQFKRDNQTIKLRWQLAKFAYQCYRRNPKKDTKMLYKNLPLDEMSFLNN